MDGLQAVHVLRQRLTLRLAARQLHAQLPHVRRQLLDPRLEALQFRLRSMGAFPDGVCVWQRFPMAPTSSHEPCMNDSEPSFFTCTASVAVDSASDLSPKYVMSQHEGAVCKHGARLR